jgi:hypothetical protein
METYRAKNVEEAVEFAYKLRDEGKYDWFRGQVQTWPPYSSLFRLYQAQDAKGQEHFGQRVAMFRRWLTYAPELRYLLNEEPPHDFFAVLQHYGIPTHYIDFSTDPGVAGFFAADTARPPSGGESCIYCLNTEELKEVWEAVKEFRKPATIETVSIDVRNLWRLQAQRGVFLFADYNWDVDYPMDRIVFPYTAYPSYPPRDQIYPLHKSPLEQLLDQYFFLETSYFGGKEIERMFAKFKAQGGHAGFAKWEEFPHGYHAEAFVAGKELAALASWDQTATREWRTDLAENYKEVLGVPQRLKLQPSAGPDEVMKSVSFGVRQVLRANPEIRRHSVEWEVTDAPSSLAHEALRDAIRAIWNGMRRLPFAIDEIADAIGTCAALQMLGLGRMTSYEEAEAIVSRRFGPSLRVGFAYPDNSGSYGYASRASLSDAMRSDLQGLLLPKYRDRAKDVRELFQVCYNPSFLFDFTSFKSLFAREVIPSQAVFERPLIIFNPALLKTFGNP